MSIFGIFGGIIAGLYGGWSEAMTTLLVFMAIDWISGVICAGIFKASDKTDSGGLSSKVGFKGLGKKCMIMLFVLIGARLDLFFASSFTREAVCIAFIVNELISITENAGAMGLPVPRVIASAIDALESHGKEGSKK